MPNKRLVFTGKEFLYIVTAILLYFQIYLQTEIVVMQYFDELVAVACLIKIIGVALRGGLEKTHGTMLILMASVAVIGLMGTASAKLQTELAPIIKDIGNTFKVFVTYLGSTYFLKGVRDKSKIIRSLATIVRGFVLVLFVCMLLHEIGVLSMGSDVRCGLRSFQFINGGAGQLSFMFYSAMLILTADIRDQKNRSSKAIYIIMALVVWVSTLRARAVMFVLIYLYLYWLVVIRQKRFKLNLGNGIAVVSAVVLFGMDQFETYFSNTATARYNLLQYGIYTMKRYFPLGSGFATYGTDAAVKYYSVLYDEYGFDGVYGLSRRYSAFTHDTYWPAVFAQFGVFGTLLMVVLIFRMFADVLKRAKNNRYAFFAAVFICITQVASSIATATFFHFVTVGVFFLLPLLFDEDKV